MNRGRRLGKTLADAGIGLAHNRLHAARYIHTFTFTRAVSINQEAVMKKDHKRVQLRAMQLALIAGAAGLCFASAANAESQAAKKMGQMGVINQTLQPKPLRSNNSAYSNNASSNTTNPGYNANSTYNPNAANAANANGAAAGTAGAAAGARK
jgi:hypothetical protein